MIKCVQWTTSVDAVNVAVINWNWFYFCLYFTHAHRTGTCIILYLIQLLPAHTHYIVQSQIHRAQNESFVIFIRNQFYFSHFPFHAISPYYTIHGAKHSDVGYVWRWYMWLAHAQTCANINNQIYYSSKQKLNAVNMRYSFRFSFVNVHIKYWWCEAGGRFIICIYYLLFIKPVGVHCQRRRCCRRRLRHRRCRRRRRFRRSLKIDTLPYHQIEFL